MALLVKNLGISVDRSGSVVTVCLDGELDASYVGVVVDCVAQQLDAATTRIVADLSRLTFCDSSGTRELILLARAAGEAGAELVLHRPSAALTRRLQMMGLERHFQLTA
ncbi:MAG TPA: STAS domain-containing protein [Aquihabitans sp.]|jgi:anti-anti-sigma factor|nr:STAS domain-containing protein [Aquihabitans sp.]